MPEVYKALVVVLVLHVATFALLRKPIMAMGMAPADYDRRRNCWIAITIGAFLFPSFWVAMAVVAVVALIGRGPERNPAALYVMLLLSLPLIGKAIPGFGPIEHFAGLDHSRVLALLVLLPAAVNALGDRRLPAPGRLATDKVLLAYFILTFALYAMVSTPLGAIRAGFVYPVLDALLLYFVASRTLTDRAKMKDFAAAFAIAAALLAVVAAFEFGKHWLLYNPLSGHLGATWEMGNYLLRNDTYLRAIASAGVPIALGYVMMLALTLFAPHIKRLRPDRALMVGGFLLVGLVAAMSRGPWLATAAALLTFVALGRAGGRSVGVAVGSAALVGLGLSSTTVGRAMLDYLPFVGGVEVGGVVYRQEIIDVSLQVLMDRPLFGAYDYLNDPRMEQLRQGQGIIDIVNTYIGVALATGFLGLSLFMAAFALPMTALLAIVRKKHNPQTQEQVEHARMVLAALVGVLVTIGTTSSVTMIAHLYWLLIGAAVAIALPALSAQNRTARVRATGTAAKGTSA